MLSAKIIILEYVCPALGTLAANQMFYAPFKDVQIAIARGSLGDLNPLPWAFMLGNCFGWVTYSVLINNLWIFFANAPGFLLALWFNLAASKLQFQQQFMPLIRKTEDIATTSSESSSTAKKEEALNEDNVAAETTETVPIYKAPRHDYWVIAISAFWMGIAALIGFGRTFSDDTQQMIVGTVNNLNLVFFYGAPLSTIRTVLSIRSAASIHIPTMLTNTFNGIFWTAYGFAVMDYFVMVPNGLGALLGFIQVFLCVAFPRVPSEEMIVEVPLGEDNVDAKGAVSCQTALMVENPSDNLLSVPFAASDDATTGQVEKGDNVADTC